MPPYDESTVYDQYLPAAEEEGSGCAECKDCECCPPGLISLRDGNGVHLGCVTPNDAETYNLTNKECAPGFIKLYKESEATPTFLGCVSESEFADMYAAVNPPA